MPDQPESGEHRLIAQPYCWECSCGVSDAYNRGILPPYTHADHLADVVTTPPSRPKCWCLNRDDGRQHEFAAGRGVGLCGETPTVWECGPHTNVWNGHDARCRRVRSSPTSDPCEECGGTGRTVQGWTDKHGFSEDQYGPCRMCTSPEGRGGT